ncbi:hypothetical protein [Methyloceanibacter sp.]|uniref:hypothetical protein n=1 Tax=Methyloceanibacter sp. TaxID=1965321 RepID=UPI00207E34A6|nr:hypothetical protein [Methyloceanibacter sp.]GFO80559.1 MAG: hypothetical protein A49_01860 [Methyloceanibacter sp.]HML91275.1 hypothetical protein [Methyloceanibacter sp.]
MSLGAKLGWLVAVCVAGLAGLLAGIWIGGEMESDIHQEFLMSANLPAECWDRIEAAAQRVIRAYEGGAEPDATP